MSDSSTWRWQPFARVGSGRRAVRVGFSVCLFIVVLAVFGWVMHRRLTQYDSPPQAVHQSTSIKVCPTKRNPISLPATTGAGGFAVFFLVLAFAATSCSSDNSKASVRMRVQHDREGRAPAQIRRNLAHFFFMPPPSLTPVL
ncbi:MAG: hypothetical protein ACRD28_01985 [Acidobacteriaceae bacterium]